MKKEGRKAESRSSGSKILVRKLVGEAHLARDARFELSSVTGEEHFDDRQDSVT